MHQNTVFMGSGQTLWSPTTSLSLYDTFRICTYRCGTAGTPNQAPHTTAAYLLQALVGVFRPPGWIH
jgi:hypothetical protein